MENKTRGLQTSWAQQKQMNDSEVYIVMELLWPIEWKQ